jgi:thioredoxin-like negative regulator of GroEL
VTLPLSCTLYRLRSLTRDHRYTEYAQRFGVRAFPTLMLFVNGVAVGQHVGATDAAGLLRYASTRLKSQPAQLT